MKSHTDLRHLQRVKEDIWVFTTDTFKVNKPTRGTNTLKLAVSLYLKGKI